MPLRSGRPRRAEPGPPPTVRHRAELPGARVGGRLRHPRGPTSLHQVRLEHHWPHHRGGPAQGRPHRLGGRAGRDRRRRGLPGVGGRRLEPRRRPGRGPGHLRADRPDGGPLPAIQPRQVLSRILGHRPLVGDPRRVRQPRRSRIGLRGQRRTGPARPHQRPHLPRPGAGHQNLGRPALLPGDVIFTGTPPGVGLGRTPQRWLAPGDELVSTIEGIGELRQRFVSG